MDKELKDLQSQFNQIPTTFTNKDKQAVRDKIEKLQNNERRKGFHIYPKLLTGVVLAVAVLIFAVTINQNPGLFMSSSNDSAGSEAKQEMANFDASIAEEESQDTNATFDEAAVESFGLNIFNPETVQDEMILPVVDIQKQGEETIITFKGDTLTGRFTNENPLTFNPNEETWSRIPVAEADIDKDIPIYFSDEELARNMLNVEEAMASDTTFSADIIEYHYSPNGSSIYLSLSSDESIPGEATNTYNETIELSNELLVIYEEYKNTFDDTLLKGLSPFDVFKLYHYANFKDNLDVEYALYIKDENQDYPDKETFISDVEYGREQTNYSPQQAKDFYNEMLEIKSFDELYLAENEALIRYTTDHEIGFRLFKDTELDVWKVSWMPIQ